MKIVIGAVILLIALSSNPAFAQIGPTNLGGPELGVQGFGLQLNVQSHPQALPNDGTSEATVTLELSENGQPLADQVLQASVTNGDGCLDRDTVTTDSEGKALIRYRAGMMAEPAELSFQSDTIPVAAQLSIPLAPITYLDLTLVTPEEYAAFLQRQASAAPIYKLEFSAFPEQLAADGGSLARLTANLTFVDGRPAAGVPLVAKVVSGAGDIAQEELATDAQGRLALYFIAGFHPGTVRIQLVEPATGLTKELDILLVEAGPARIQLFYNDPFSPGLLREGALLPADGMSALPLVAEVTDLSGIPLPGVELNIEILGVRNGWLEVLDTTSDAAGRVEFTYYAGSFTGPVRLRAYVADGLKYD